MHKRNDTLFRSNPANNGGIEGKVLEIALSGKKEIFCRRNMKCQKEISDFILIAVFEIQLIRCNPLSLQLILPLLFQELLRHKRDTIGFPVREKIRKQCSCNRAVSKKDDVLPADSV